MTQVKLQVPMSREARNALEIYAKSMGFDSAQAYIRFLAKAAADGRKVNLDQQSSARPFIANEHLNRIAEEAQQGINVSRALQDNDAWRYIFSL